MTHFLVYFINYLGEGDYAEAHAETREAALEPYGARGRWATPVADILTPTTLVFADRAWRDQAVEQLGLAVYKEFDRPQDGRLEVQGFRRGLGHALYFVGRAGQLNAFDCHTFVSTNGDDRFHYHAPA